MRTRLNRGRHGLIPMDFGFNDVIERGSCGTCARQDMKIAVMTLSDEGRVTLCSDCLVDLANLVADATADSAEVPRGT